MPDPIPLINARRVLQRGYNVGVDALDPSAAAAIVRARTAAFIRSRERRMVILVAAVLIGLMTHGTHAGTGDEPHYLAIAHSMAFDGDLSLSNNYGANEPLIAGGALQPEKHVRPDARGVIRPLHDIGLPLVFVPLVRVAEDMPIHDRRR